MGRGSLGGLSRYRYISKQTTTRWYIGAWVAWVIGLAASVIVHQSGASPNSGLATIVISLALVMGILWIGALVRLARQHDWGWFGALLVLQLLGLGIVGMAAYALAGPVDIDLSRTGIE